MVNYVQQKYCKRGLFREQEDLLNETTIQYRTLYETEP